MAHLARKLRTIDYFTLGLGAMVGVGWLIVMGGSLERGGPLAGVAGFAVAGAFLPPIGYVYSRLVQAMPVAGSEIAFTERAFHQGFSHATGWTVMLAYRVVCPREAVATDKIASDVFPPLVAAF